MFIKHYVWTAKRRRKDGETVYVSGSFIMSFFAWGNDVHRKAVDEAILGTNYYELGYGWIDVNPILTSVSKV